MFISFSKFFGKSGLGIGVGFKLGGKNKKSGCLSACLSIFVLFFKIMIYMILFSFWIVYAMIYGIVWLCKPKSSKNKTSGKKIQVSFDDVDITVKGEEPVVNKTKPSLLLKSNRGLYPHEILMLSYAPSYTTGKNSFQNFWLYKYDVEDPQKLLDKLLEEGFLEIDNDLYSILSKETAVRLKSILSSYGAKVSGKKDELIHRIIETAPSDILEKEFPFRCYALTEKGEAELSDNDYVIYCHRNEIDEREISKIMHSENLPYRDAIWGYYNKRAMEQGARADFVSYCSTKLSMAEFLIEEKNYTQAFPILCEIACYKLNNVRNIEMLTNDKWLIDVLKKNFHKSCFPYGPYSDAHLFDYILKPIKDLQWKLDVSDFDYKNMILDEFKRNHLPFYIFHDEEMADIVLWEIQGDTESLARIYEIAESRFLKNGVFQK